VPNRWSIRPISECRIHLCPALSLEAGLAITPGDLVNSLINLLLVKVIVDRIHHLLLPKSQV